MCLRARLDLEGNSRQCTAESLVQIWQPLRIPCIVAETGSPSNNHGDSLTSDLYIINTCPTLHSSLPCPQNPAISQLQEKIELEYKIRDGATKLLQASNNSTQSMEASKGLFVSNAKIIALMRELQQLQTDTGAKSDVETPAACPAKLAISG